MCLSTPVPRPDALPGLRPSTTKTPRVHLAGDLITTAGVPLLWPWRPKPPRLVRSIPGMRQVWKPSGHLALPLIGNAGSAREWALCSALTVYLLYGLAATAGVLGMD